MAVATSRVPDDLRGMRVRILRQEGEVRYAVAVRSPAVTLASVMNVRSIEQSAESENLLRARAKCRR